MTEHASTQTLKEMFPFHEVESLRKVLSECNGDVAAAASHLLGDSVESDSILVRELLSQMAVEWEKTHHKVIPPEIRTDPARLEAFLADSPTARVDLSTRAKQPTEGGAPSLASAAKRLFSRMQTAFSAAPSAEPIFKRYYPSSMTEPMLPTCEEGDDDLHRSRC